MDIGVYHPQIVHFVVALLFVGVILRLVSLTGRLRFTGPAAATLILVGTLASVAAVKSGDEAHGPAERIPGAREAVHEHEEWGERTRNLFLLVSLLEIGVLVLSTRGEERRKLARGVGAASAAVGLVGLFFLYETGEHGGELVYSYAGGVGTRSGEPQDVQNLLVAGLYHAAQQDREAGRKEDAARLVAELERRRPNDPSVRLIAIESMLKDRGDAAGALAALRGFAAGDNQQLRVRSGLLRVDALEAAGQPDSATALLQQLQRDFPESGAVKNRAKKGAPPAAPRPAAPPSADTQPSAPQPAAPQR